MMLSNKEIVLSTLRQYALDTAKGIQENAGSMSGTELYENEEFIPDFQAAKNKKNMLQRLAGFTCRSTAGRVVRLIQPYDSDIYTQEPEELPALWGFKWSQDPRKALPFVAISTSPYMRLDCCTDGGIFRSKVDDNVWAPHEYSEGWEEVLL